MMIDKFVELVPYKTKIVNIREYKFKGGCLGCFKCATNGKCIFFNADFISKLYPNELDFILCHQIMHIINRDIWRGPALAGDDFHRACDIYNNDQLIRI